MSEITPGATETTPRSHLKPVREDTRAPAPDEPAAEREGGMHWTGLLAVLLAAAVFAGLAQFSANRQLRTENGALEAELASARVELEASRAQMSEAREALGGVRDALLRIEALLSPPAAAEAPAGEGAAAEGPAD